jgi:hypothetical protein
MGTEGVMDYHKRRFMKLLFSLLIIPLVFMAATLATPSSACDYELDRAFNMTFEGMEAKPILTVLNGGTKGVIYLRVRLQNKSECRFDNVKVAFTLRTEYNNVFTSGDIDAGNFGPYETRALEYRVKDLTYSTDLKGFTCDLTLKQ